MAYVSQREVSLAQEPSREHQSPLGSFNDQFGSEINNKGGGTHTSTKYFDRCRKDLKKPSFSHGGRGSGKKGRANAFNSE